MTLSGTLLAVERELWTGGAAPYLRNLDDDCLVAFTEMAGVYSRGEIAAMVEGGPGRCGASCALGPAPEANGPQGP